MSEIKPSNLSGPKELHIPKNRKGQFRTCKGLNIAAEKKKNREQEADMLMIPTHIKGFIHQIPHRNSVENVFTEKILLECEKLHIIKAVLANLFGLFE